VPISSAAAALLVRCVAVSSFDHHNHQPNEAEVRRGLLLRSMHEKIEQNPTVPMKRVYDDVIADCSDDSDEFMPQFSNVRTRVQRYRSSFVPPLPRTINDVDIDGEYAKTWKGRQFLTYQDNGCGIAVFMTTKMIKVLPDCQTLYVDGTFKSAPYPYTQLVTIHGFFHGFVIQLCFSLLTGKSTAHYQQLFQHLKRAVLRKTGQSLSPQSIVVDFEASLKIAIETEFANSAISGCYFHFCSSLWRHVQELHLSGPYNTSRSLRKCIRSVMALAFLPIPLVRQNFNMLLYSNGVAALVRRFPTLQQWLHYVRDTYVARNAVFATPMWNVFRRHVDTRTNNHLEGWYALSC
jgi:hypothetical protein